MCWFWRVAHISTYILKMSYKDYLNKGRSPAVRREGGKAVSR